MTTEKQTFEGVIDTRKERTIIKQQQKQKCNIENNK